MSGEGQQENLEKIGNITGTSIVMQTEGGQFRNRISDPTPWYQNQHSYVPDQIIEKK